MQHHSLASQCNLELSIDTVALHHRPHLNAALSCTLQADCTAPNGSHSLRISLQLSCCTQGQASVRCTGRSAFKQPASGALAAQLSSSHPNQLSSSQRQVHWQLSFQAASVRCTGSSAFKQPSKPAALRLARMGK